MLGLARYVKSKTLKLTSRILTRSRRWLVSVDKIKSGHVISFRFKVPTRYLCFGASCILFATTGASLISGTIMNL